MDLLKNNRGVRLSDVQAIYDGGQAHLYELFMGRQIHVGGLESTMDLAERAGIGPGMRGIELCCGSGATMRALVRLLDVASMVGAEAATAPVERGRRTCAEQGLEERIAFVIGDATDTKLPDAEADFVLGEDAWCYVLDKAQLVAETVRLTRPGGVIACTDWIEGAAGLSDDEADHVLQIMTFPNLLTVDGYRELFEAEGCGVIVAEDTGRFGPAFALYAEMVRKQLAFDAFEILGFDRDIVDIVIEQLSGLARLGAEHKLGQIRLVVRRPS
jgi:sarcosine/dimethylglycine N-methyltransferase